MSGHSKWSQIKRQKGVADQRRGELFSKLARAISLAVREGGSDNPEFNSKLRLAIEKAKANNMPNDNIERAIESGRRFMKEKSLGELTIEGYGPAGVAILAKAVTDNKNRTLAEIRKIFREHNAAVGEQGSTAYIFTPDPKHPIFTVTINDKQQANEVLKLVDSLKEHEEITDIFVNLEVSRD